MLLNLLILLVLCALYIYQLYTHQVYYRPTYNIVLYIDYNGAKYIVVNVFLYREICIAFMKQYEINSIIILM